MKKKSKFSILIHALPQTKKLRFFPGILNEYEQKNNL
jgi:hypothetical protein